MSHKKGRPFFGARFVLVVSGVKPDPRVGDVARCWLQSNTTSHSWGERSRDWHPALVNQPDEAWPWPDLSLPKEIVRESHLKAFVLAKEILLHHQRVRPDRDFRRWVLVNRQPPIEQLCPAFKSWLDYTAGEN